MPLLQSSRRAYLTRIRQIMPDKVLTCYTGKTLMELIETKSGMYKCSLEKRCDVQIEQVKPLLANRLLIELGESLYPIELNITLDGKIDSITNFEEVKERRTKKAKELLSTFPTIPFRRYIEMSQGYLEEEEVFRGVLVRDSFIQLFFSCASESPFCYTCDNFPRKGEKNSFYCEIDKKDIGTCLYIAQPAFPTPSHVVMGGSVVSDISAKRELVGIKAEFKLQEDMDVYKREIEISMLDGDPIL